MYIEIIGKYKHYFLRKYHMTLIEFPQINLQIREIIEDY